MRAGDGQLSHFNQASNALLLPAYVALRKGDSSGERRWLAPRKGVATLNPMLNVLFDLEPTAETPDHERAVLELMKRERKTRAGGFGYQSAR